MKSMKILVIWLSITNFAGIDASWSAFTPQWENQNFSDKKGSNKKIYKEHNENALEEKRERLEIKNPINHIYPEDLNIRYESLQERQKDIKLWSLNKKLSGLEKQIPSKLRFYIDMARKDIDLHKKENELDKLIYRTNIINRSICAFLFYIFYKSF